jgi:hypothetical protein
MALKKIALLLTLAVALATGAFLWQRKTPDKHRLPITK